MDTCACDTGRPLDECCRPIIDGDREAATAVELMRSRYSAFVLGEVDWVMASHHPDTVGEVDREQVEEWSRGSEWLGLRILDARDGGEGDDEGVVHFRARYRSGGQQIDHVEHALFRRLDGAWRFHSVLDDPEAPQLVPVGSASTVGRNDPCPCGSGRKHKRCCGARA